MSSWPAWYLPVAIVLGLLALSLFGVYWVFDRLADPAEANDDTGHR
ncbi:MAG: hypothetical protein ACREPA_02345 [Candidatus Dormibacteraceae bacterium]